MSVSQTLTRRRDADLLERALSGDPVALSHPLLVDDASELAVLVRLAEDLPRPRVHADPDFVARLRDQLVTEAARPPLPNAVDDRTAEVVHAPVGPRTLRIPRAARLATGLATAVVLVAALLGGLSTRALPGDTLYPVKLMIGDAQVRLAGSDLGRGKALLGQVDERLDEVDALVAAGDPSALLVNDTLARASDDLGAAQRELLTTDAGPSDVRALQVLADAGAQATGRLAALRERVPIESVPAVDRLLQQLSQGHAAMVQQLDQLVRAGVCTDVCSSIRATLEQEGTLLTRLLGSLAGASSLTPRGPAGPPALGSAQNGSTDDGTGPGTGAGSIAGGGLPTSAPDGGSLSLPGVSVPGVTVPGATVSGGTGDGLQATVPGATASLPGAQLTVPTVGVSLPGTSSTGLLPGVTVSGSTSTLGDATIPVPGVSVGGDCVLGLGDLCLGG